jgi:hypothetical protein
MAIQKRISRSAPSYWRAASSQFVARACFRENPDTVEMRRERLEKLIETYESNPEFWAALQDAADHRSHT